MEGTLRFEHALFPSRPIYIVGDSFGGCLSLAVAARNPSIDLVVVLSNPGQQNTQNKFLISTYNYTLLFL